MFRDIRHGNGLKNIIMFPLLHSWTYILLIGTLLWLKPYASSSQSLQECLSPYDIGDIFLDNGHEHECHPLCLKHLNNPFTIHLWARQSFHNAYLLIWDLCMVDEARNPLIHS